MCNEAVKTTDGHIVFIDDDKRHIYDLHHDVRFIETGAFPLSNYREFIGFICGVLAVDADITEIYVDGLTNIIKTIGNDDLVLLLKKLTQLSKLNGVDFVLSMNCAPENLPAEASELLI